MTFSPLRRPLAVRSLLVLSTLFGAALLAPSGAAAATRCPAKPRTVARASGSVLWVRRGTLYGCSTKEGLKPIPRLLGPWHSGQVVFDGGIQAAWTVRRPDGTERLWAADVVAGPSHSWLRDGPLVPRAGGTPAREGTVERLIERGDVVAYATTDGDVVLAANGSTLNADPVDGLPALPPPARRQLLVGSFPDADIDALADSLELTSDSQCGGLQDYALSFAPQGTPLHLTFAVDTGNAGICN